jgi:hypothetical protein
MRSKSTGYIKYFLAVTALVYAGLGNAALIDQSQYNIGFWGGLASFNESGLAQSFIQSENNIVGAGIFIYDPIPTSVGGRIDIELWDKLPSSSGANKLRSGMTDAHAGSWADVLWVEGVYFVSPNTTLFLVLTGENKNMSIAGSIRNKYLQGQGYVSGVLTNNDYTFRTFYTAVVPVPAAVWLFGTALIGLVGYSNKRGKAV